jgi:XTP/dITP diphosphohydrolase
VAEILVIGSGNPKKAAELAELLRDLPWEVRSLKDFPPLPEPVEDGDTFEANAVKKAVYYAAQLGHWCVADDSGLMVDALDGAPGVYSARYSGPDANDARNNAKLLAALENVPEALLTARFVCCAALVRPGGEPHVETGIVEGRLAAENRGLCGFGYDPLFIPEGHDKTFGEMTLDEKHAVSHRGRAFRKMRDYLAGLTP